MWHRRRRWAVVLTLIVSFVLIASHVYLLHETPAQQRACPYCQWLQHLSEGVQPAIVVMVAPVIGQACLTIAAVFPQTPHHLPFSARSPPNA